MEPCDYCDGTSEVEAEAARRYPHGPVPTVGDYQQDIFRDVFIAGARWLAARIVSETN